MFKITQNSGFHITFKNGVTLSTQFGSNSYSQNRHRDVHIDNDCTSSRDCEIAIWNEKDKWLTKDILYKAGLYVDDDVKGWVEVSEWSKIVEACENWSE